MRKGVTLLQGGGGVPDSSEADRDVMDTREDFWSMSGGFLFRHHTVPSHHRTRNSVFPYIDGSIKQEIHFVPRPLRHQRLEKKMMKR